MLIVFQFPFIYLFFIFSFLIVLWWILLFFSHPILLPIFSSPRLYVLLDPFSQFEHWYFSLYSSYTPNRTTFQWTQTMALKKGPVPNYQVKPVHAFHVLHVHKIGKSMKLYVELVAQSMHSVHLWLIVLTRQRFHRELGKVQVQLASKVECIQLHIQQFRSMQGWHFLFQTDRHKMPVQWQLYRLWVRILGESGHWPYSDDRTRKMRVD